MITALATQQQDRIQLAITYPERKRPVYKYVINRQEATIVVYTLCRNYIFKRLNAWLKHRMFTLKHVDAGRYKTALQLMLLLGMYEKQTLRNLCTFVARHEAELKALAPGYRSRFIKHYQYRIIPIIHFCIEIGG